MFNNNLKEELEKTQNEMVHQNRIINDVSEENRKLKETIDETYAAELKLLSPSEINDPKYRDLVFEEVVYQDVVETINVETTDGKFTKKIYQLRKPFFLMRLFKDIALQAMRMKVEVGIDNFPEYEAMKHRNNELEEKLVRIEEDSKEINSDYAKEKAFTQYLNESLGQNIFVNHRSEFERTYKAK